MADLGFGFLRLPMLGQEHCPQHLPIRQHLEHTAAALEAQKKK